MYIDKQLFDLIVVKLTVASIIMIANFVNAARKHEEVNSVTWFSNGFCIITTFILWIICICLGDIS